MITAVLICLLLLLWFSISKRPSNMPPGPIGVPVFGYLPFLNSNPAKTFSKLAIKYGKLVTVRLGKFDCVVINDFKIMKDVFSMTEVTGRPNIPIFRIFSKRPDRPQGLVLGEGLEWQELRRFTMRHLKDLGVTPKHISDIILLEVNCMLKTIEEKEGVPFDFEHTLQIAVFNVIWNILTGERAEVNDPKFIHLMKSVNQNTEDIFLPMLLSFLWESLYNLVPGFLYDYDRMIRVKDWFHNCILMTFVEQKSTYVPSQMRHMMDYFISEMKVRGEDDEIFTENELVTLFGDLMVAGSETTTTTLMFAGLYLLHYPKVQDRIYQDIKEQIGEPRLITMEDKQRLPYLEAFILEVQRVANIVSIGVFHRSLESIIVEGYTIPKDTIVIANLDSVHNDPQYWDNPELFLPERFLDETGCAVPNKDGFAAFSLGKRRCIGESLARAELFLFLSNLIQKYSLEPTSPTRIPEIEWIPGLVSRPKHYQLIFRRRNK